MEGTVTHFNDLIEQGIIEGDDGRRYCFYLRDWMTNRIPYLSDRVVFEVDDSFAIGVCLCTCGETPKGIFGMEFLRIVRSVVAASRTKLLTIRTAVRIAATQRLRRWTSVRPFRMAYHTSGDQGKALHHRQRVAQ